MNRTAPSSLSDQQFWATARSHQWVPSGYVPIAHLFTGEPSGMWEAGLSRNHRMVMRIQDPEGNLITWRLRRPKSVKYNRLPRGYSKTAGVWNGQPVAEMIKAA